MPSQVVDRSNPFPTDEIFWMEPQTLFELLVSTLAVVAGFNLNAYFDVSEQSWPVILTGNHVIRFVEALYLLFAPSPYPFKEL